MKKFFVILLAVSFLAAPVLCRAEDNTEAMEPEMMRQGPMMHQPGMMLQGKHMMMSPEEGMGSQEGPMMGKKMMQWKKNKMSSSMGEIIQAMIKEKTIIPTKDGGVIVLYGNKLQKYDKDLNLLKEVTLQMDMDAITAMMKQMKDACPMMKKMKDKGLWKEKMHENMPGETEKE